MKWLTYSVSGKQMIAGKVNGNTYLSSAWLRSRTRMNAVRHKRTATKRPSVVSTANDPIHTNDRARKSPTTLHGERVVRLLTSFSSSSAARSARKRQASNRLSSRLSFCWTSSMLVLIAPSRPPCTRSAAAGRPPRLTWHRFCQRLFHPVWRRVCPPPCCRPCPLPCRRQAPQRPA